MTDSHGDSQSQLCCSLEIDAPTPRCIDVSMIDPEVGVCGVYQHRVRACLHAYMLTCLHAYTSTAVYPCMRARM